MDERKAPSEVAPVREFVGIGHEWRMWKKLLCCARCGVVRNEKNAVKICRGVVTVSLR